MATIEEIESRRAARKAAVAESRAAQYAKDLEALDSLEVEHGDGCVASLEVDKFVDGLPTMIVIRTPSQDQYKRFCQQVRRAAGNLEARGAAQDLLAESCWVYPSTPDDRKRMLAAFPGVLTSVAVRAAKLAEFRADDEGKG